VGKQVTSMQKELGRTLPMEEVMEKVKRHFARIFNCKFVTADALLAR
jgi:lipoyl(octanoyl) transferase